MGKLRSLSCQEILAQLYWANKVCRLRGQEEPTSSSSTAGRKRLYPVNNIVFMGMGEPADNAQEVIKASHALVHPKQFALAGRRVTISTVGPTPSSFADLARAPVTLAWSVHTANDYKRQRVLVPTTRYTMKELREGFLEALSARSRALKSTMLEITLLDRVNDFPEDALELVDFCQPILQRVPKLVVNLIPWNNIGGSSNAKMGFRPPTLERVAAFQKILGDRGIRCYVRTTRGDDESAACGQLATTKKQKPKLP